MAKFVMQPERVVSAKRFRETQEWIWAHEEVDTTTPKIPMEEFVAHILGQAYRFKLRTEDEDKTFSKQKRFSYVEDQTVIIMSPVFNHGKRVWLIAMDDMKPRWEHWCREEALRSILDDLGILSYAMQKYVGANMIPTGPWIPFYQGFRDYGGERIVRFTEKHQNLLSSMRKELLRMEVPTEWKLH